MRIDASMTMMCLSYVLVNAKCTPLMHLNHLKLLFSSYSTVTLPRKSPENVKMEFTKNENAYAKNKSVCS